MRRVGADIEWQLHDIEWQFLHKTVGADIVGADIEWQFLEHEGNNIIKGLTAITIKCSETSMRKIPECQLGSQFR